MTVLIFLLSFFALLIGMCSVPLLVLLRVHKREVLTVLTFPNLFFALMIGTCLVPLPRFPAVVVFACIREAFLEFYPEEAVQDLEPASFFAKYKTNRITLQQAKDYEEVLVKR